MKKRSRDLLVHTMRRFHDREQVIERIINAAVPTADGGTYTVTLTEQDMALLRKEAS